MYCVRPPLETVSRLSTQQTYGLPKSLILKVGAKYMLTINIDTADGLTNSSTGVLTAIDFAINKKTTEKRPLRIWLNFDEAVIGKIKRNKATSSLSRYKNRLNRNRTTLLAFFELCGTDSFAKTLLYDEIPAYYTYDKQRGIFNRRRRGSPVDGTPGVYKEHVIGRVYTVHPNNFECFYLRLLLHTVCGPTSFTDLRKVDDILYPSYQAACQARHLLENDQHWDDALAELCVSNNPHRLRNLLVVFLTFCALSNAAQLWEKYKEQLCEDFFRNISRDQDTEINDNCRDLAINQCLLAIQKNELIAVGDNTLSEYGLPTPTIANERINREYAAELNYNAAEPLETLENGVPSMTPEQKQVFDRVCHSVNNNLGQILFLYAPGGTGKTFLTKLILADLRNQNKIALAVDSSGIAATLLPGGKTAHTMLKIPIDLDRTENPVCGITRNSDKVQVIRECSLIIWDECTMAHKKAIEAVDRTLRDIRHIDQPMAGITVLFCGDLIQILPVIPRGTRADEHIIYYIPAFNNKYAGKSQR